MQIPEGRPGSWFAEWEGESLPCIHRHAIHEGRYVDPGIDNRPSWPRFLGELQAKRKAIVTISHPPGEDGIRRRKGYVGIWEIDHVQVSGTTLTFDLGGLLKRFRE